jgi:hypothetical protein
MSVSGKMFGAGGAPPVASSRKDGCRDPPPEDEEGQGAQNEGAKFEVMPVLLLLVGFEVGLVAGSQYRGVSNWSVLFGLGVVRFVRFGRDLLPADERLGSRRRLGGHWSTWSGNGQRGHDL